MVSAYQGINLHEQDLCGKRLGNILIRTYLIAGNYIAFITQCRKEDDRHIVPGSDVTAHFLAIHAGHHDVEYDNVILLLIRQRTCINSVIYGIDLKTVFTEEDFNDFS